MARLRVSGLEMQLAVEVIRKTETKSITIGSQRSYDIGVDEKFIMRVLIDSSEAEKGRHYRLDGSNLILLLPKYQGEIRVQYIVLPTPFDRISAKSRQLCLADCYNEVYVYHIMSRSALIDDDIERLNNYSLIYEAALKRACEAMYSSSIKAERYKNIW